MRDWPEIIYAVTLPTVAIAAVFLITTCKVKEYEEKTQRHEAITVLKDSLAEKGFTAKEIKCIAEKSSEDLLCVNLSWVEDEK